MKRSIALIAALLVACSPDPEPESNGTADTGVEEDAGATDAGGDAATEDDTGGDDPDTGETEPDTGGEDAGVNTNVGITATVGDTTEGFERAFYGITDGSQTQSGDPELHVEVYAGGDPGCPEMDSATPDRTLIIGGMTFPEIPLEQREEDGVAIALLDFAGTLTDEPTLAATGEIIYFKSWELCAECEGDDPNGYLSFDVDALLENGNVRGHVYATHCASLNSP